MRIGICLLLGHSQVGSLQKSERLALEFSVMSEAFLTAGVMIDLATLLDLMK